MIISLAETTPPAEVGLNIAEHLNAGAPYVCIAELPFASMAEIQRQTYIQKVAGAIGRMATTNNTPGTEQWRLDRMSSPNTSYIPLHTDNPFLVEPEEFVGFWNVKSSEVGGENIILPVADLLDWATKTSQRRETIEEAATVPVSFTNGKAHAVGLLLDISTEKARHDVKYIDDDHSALAGRFATLLTAESVPSQDIKLKAGSVLFLNNRTSLHARAPYTDHDRLSIRVRLRNSG